MTEQINTNPTSLFQLKEGHNSQQGSSVHEQSLRQSNIADKEDNNESEKLDQHAGGSRQQTPQSQVFTERIITPEEEKANANNRQDESSHHIEDENEKHSLIVDQQLQIQSSDPPQPKNHEAQADKDSFPSRQDDHNIPETSNLQLTEYQKYLQKEQQREYQGDDYDRYQQEDYDINRPISQQQSNLQITTEIYKQEIIQFTDDDITLKTIRRLQTDQSTNAFNNKDFRYTGIEQSQTSRLQEKKKENDQTPIAKNIAKDTPPPTKKPETVLVRQIQKPKVIEQRQVQAKINKQKTAKDRVQIRSDHSQPIIKKESKQSLTHQTVMKEQELKPTQEKKKPQASTAQLPVNEEKKEKPKPSNSEVNKAPTVRKIKKTTKVAVQQRIHQENKAVQPTIKQMPPPPTRKDQTERNISRDPPPINPPPQKPNPSTVRITVLSTDQSIPQLVVSTLPPVTSLMIVSQAVKQRVGTTYSFFLKYIFEYQKTVNYYKNIVQNVYLQIQQRKNSKKQLLNILLDYFSNYAKLNRQFYDRCYKITSLQQKSSANKFESIKTQLKPGYEQLIFLRKSIANDSYNIANYITNTVNTSILQAFQNYNATINAEEQRQINRRIQHLQRQTTLKKLVAQIDKNFNRALLGKEKNDIFAEIIKLINEEQTHRNALKSYGRGLIDLRQAYIHSERELFNRLQSTLNHFKTQSKTVYSVGRREFDLIQDMTAPIKTHTKFAEISNLTDLDYIRYVLELQSKRQTTEFTNRHFEQYLDLVYFDKIVGNIKDLYKGATTKVFPMEHNGEELVHTVSGNLVFFNRERDELRDKFVIKNINVKMMGQGVVEVDEVIRGILFDDNRTLRLKLKDADRAEELICYLNEKEENIVLAGQRP